MERFESPVLWGISLLGFLWLFSCNPFAPAYEQIDRSPDQVLGNRRSIDGMFEWFKNSYELKDTTLYGQILGPGFTFIYNDFATSNTVQWDRQTEMTATYNMFRQVKSTTLQWNHYLSVDTSSSDTLAVVERAFNLIIVESDQEIYRGTGSALLTLQRPSPQAPWEIKEWFDRSDF